MADRLQRGAERLAQRFKDHGSRRVIYVVGNDQVWVDATVGKGKLFRLEEDYSAIRMEWSDRDYFIAAAEILINGVAVLPDKGHQIIDTTDGTNAIYEVLAPGGEKPYRKLSGREITHQIHTKFLGELDAPLLDE